MKIIIKIMAFCLLLALSVSMVACTGAGSPIETTPNPSGSIPQSPTQESADSDTTLDFTVLDADGREVKLSDFYGKPIVLNFWASWCPPCKSELPDFEAACKQYEGKVTFLMVNMTDGQRETVEVAKSFVADKGYTFPVYFDTKYEAAYLFGVSSIPQTYFLDAEGSVVARATGLISAAQLEEGIGMIYSE